MNPINSSNLPIIGWREWIAVPNLGIHRIKAKIDSGARSSSLYAFALEEFQRENEDWVRFQVHPIQRNQDFVVEAEARVLEHRLVRSSSGKAMKRPVIITEIELFGLAWNIELTLANREEMGFRMLLGREAFRRRFLVDAGRSYLGGKGSRKKKH